MIVLISREEFLKYTQVNGLVDVDKYAQYIKIAQDLHIEPVIGTQLLNKLITDVQNETLIAPYTTLLDYIKNVLIHYAMVQYLPSAPFIIGNQGIYKKIAENATDIQESELHLMIENERAMAQGYMLRLEKYLCANSNLFPELNTNINGEVKPNGGRENYTGWVL
jgi:hypothetical protein